MFITFEGGEGAGKSTQALRLFERLRAAGYPARFTREPGGTPLSAGVRALLLHPDDSLTALSRAELIKPGQFAQLPEGADDSRPADMDSAADRDSGTIQAEPMLPATELLLLGAARAQHVARIREWLAGGKIVVCDRYIDSTRAYQGAGRGLDAAVIRQVERLATGGLVPDLTILFDLPVDVGQRRKRRHLRQSHLQLSLFEPPSWNRLDNETLEFHSRVRSAYLDLAAREPERFIVLDANLPPDHLADNVWQAVQSRLPSSTAFSNRR